MTLPRLRVDPADRIRAAPGRPRRPRGAGRGIFGGVARVAVLLLLWTAIIGSVLLGYFALTLPDTSALTNAERRPSATILAADGSLLTTFGDLFGQPLTLREMSPFLPKAVIATEDRRFYRHFGIHPIGLLLGSFANCASSRVF